MALSPESLENLRKSLPWGSTTLLAEEFGFTQQYISNILHGGRNNDKVIDRALELAEEAAQRTEAKEAKLNAL